MAVSKDEIPVFIRVIRVIRGFFQPILDCILRAEILWLIPLGPNPPPATPPRCVPEFLAVKEHWVIQPLRAGKLLHNFIGPCIERSAGLKMSCGGCDG